MKKGKRLILTALAATMLLFAGVMLSACGLKDNELDHNVASKVYDGQAIAVNAEALGEAGVTVEYKLAGADDETYTEVAPKNVGEYTARITVEKTSEYKELVVTVNFEITPRELNVNWYEPDDLVYSRSAKMPTVEISTELVAGDECQVAAQLKAGEDNVSVGEFTCRATLSNPNYKVVDARAEQSYTIEPKPVVLNWPATSYQYDGTAHLPTVTISSGLLVGDECEVIEAVAEDDDNVNAGDFYCDVTLSNSNYEISGQTSRQYSISKVNYPNFNGRYKRVGSNTYQTFGLKVGETVEFDLHFNNEAYADLQFEGAITFTVYEPYTTGAATVEGNLVTLTKYGLVYIQGHVAESRNYYANETNGVQRIEVDGLECVEGEQYVLPLDCTAQYGQTLANVGLPQGFSWNNPATPVGEIGEHTFMATFTPYDYEDVGVYLPKDDIEITVTVGKANPDYVVPTGLTAKYGQLVSDVELPEGFTWHTSGTPVGGLIGANAHLVDYTPADTEHYNVVLNILVYIDVTKGDQRILVQHNSKEFDGDPITAADLGLDYLGDGEYTLEFKLSSDPDEAYSTVAPNAAHEYSVRITVTEGSTYMGAVKEVLFTIYMPE